MLDIDCHGQGTLLYPRDYAENQFPNDADNGRQFFLPGAPVLRVGPPYGVDTLILLSTAQPLSDPYVLNFEGVASRGTRGVASPLERLLNQTSGGTRGFRGRSAHQLEHWAHDGSQYSCGCGKVSSMYPSRCRRRNGSALHRHLMEVNRCHFPDDFSLPTHPRSACSPRFCPRIAAAQTPPSEASAEDSPHDSFDFWNGFFDSVNPYSPNYGNKAASRGPTDQLPDPQAQTQYLHYNSDKKRLRYASDIDKEELLDHDGDVSVNIAIAQYRPGSGEAKVKASQLRIDTTQIHPLINIAAPLAWAAIASISPNMAGTISLDDMGFRSPQATEGTSKILLTKGTGKMAVNISRAAQQSFFVKTLNIMMQGAKIAAPHRQPARHQRTGAQHFH